MITTLIADDSHAELDVLLYLIRKYALPLQAVTAQDGEEALNYLQRFPVDLLITDIRMPFLDGLALSQKALEINPDMKIIISSGYQDFTYAKTAISLGVEEYLLKPIQPDEFVSLIHRLTEKMETEKESQELRKLQLSYSRDQITWQLIYESTGAARKNGKLPPRLYSLMPTEGKLLLLAASPSLNPSLRNLKSEICGLAESFFQCPARCIPLKDCLLLAIDGIPNAEHNRIDDSFLNEQCGQFVSRLNRMYPFALTAQYSYLPPLEAFRDTVLRLRQNCMRSLRQLPQTDPTVPLSRTLDESCPDNPTEEPEQDGMLIPDTTNGKVRFLCDYISTHYRENLGLEVLADIAYLHPDYLSRIFKKETGMNLNHYIKTFRLNQACRLLETTQQKIAAVSTAVGYQNCSYFIRVFTENFGLSPEKYRQQHIAGERRMLP